MTPDSLHDSARRIALTYPFTEHCWPFGPEYDVFKVGGRIFMLTTHVRGRGAGEPQGRAAKITAEPGDLSQH
ncbi:Uncharacterized protein conserved in bacteria [Raoultella terrigena]|uniref:Uncharacterized protein conserved in bacteria n=1 Tax=Raoultella terrigena TaxID=577 RepID=A0A4U9DFA9_RAOTE|nr:Uncharacterized protein conserved in bacteria [Raoultella terrigena]